MVYRPALMHGLRAQVLVFDVLDEMKRISDDWAINHSTRIMRERTLSMANPYIYHLLLFVISLVIVQMRGDAWHLFVHHPLGKSDWFQLHQRPECDTGDIS